MQKKLKIKVKSGNKTQAMGTMITWIVIFLYTCIHIHIYIPKYIYTYIDVDLRQE